MYAFEATDIAFLALTAIAVATIVWMVVDAWRARGRVPARGRLLLIIICAVMLVAALVLQFVNLKASTGALCDYFPMTEVLGPEHNVPDVFDPTSAKNLQSCRVRGRSVVGVSAGLVILTPVLYWRLRTKVRRR